MSRRKPKPKTPRPYYRPSVWAKIAFVFQIVFGVMMQLSWPVKTLFLALPIAGYFAYPYYEEWQVWNEEFETLVFNINDERLYNLNATQYDNQVKIGLGSALPNDTANARGDYTNQRTVTLFWSFGSRDHGRTRLTTPAERTCYYKTVELPVRKQGQKYLQIGIYNRDVLRIRWGSNGFISSSIRDGEFTEAEAWRHGIVPLSSNWRKIDPTNWSEKTTWNEAVDGPKVDAEGKGAWLTLRADTAKPCEE